MSLESAGVVVPPAFRIVFYKEKGLDLVRFKQVSELIPWLKMRNASFDDISTGDLQVVADTTIGKCLHALATSYIKTEGETKMVAEIGRLAHGLTSISEEEDDDDAELELPHDVRDDLQILWKALGFADTPFAERKTAFEALEQKQRSAAYTGVLAAFLGDGECWKAIAAMLGDSASRLQDTHKTAM